MRISRAGEKPPRANDPIRINLTQREHDDSFTYTTPEQLLLTADDHDRDRVGDKAQKQETWGSGDVHLPIQSSYSCDPAHFFLRTQTAWPNVISVAWQRIFGIPRDRRLSGYSVCLSGEF